MVTDRVSVREPTAEMVEDFHGVEPMIWLLDALVTNLAQWYSGDHEISEHGIAEGAVYD